MISSTFAGVSESEDSAPGPQGTGDEAHRGQAARRPDEQKAWTVAHVLQWTVARFTQLGLDGPRTDAEYLLAHALKCARVDLYVRFDMVVGAEERARFRELVRRRLAREPVAYIEGTRGFHALDLELAVDKRVLVPRPETELLVDWVLERLTVLDVEASADDPDAPPATRPQTEGTILDVGTGSGAIALSIKRARPGLRVVASDVSVDALAVARGNAERAELDVEFHSADVYAGVPDVGGWSVIVSNPPYIDTDVLAGLAPEVRDWEPSLALDGGADGLDVVRRLVAEARDRLTPGGFLALEIGFDQSERVVALMTAAGLTNVQTRNDHDGHVRMVMGDAPS